MSPTPDDIQRALATLESAGTYRVLEAMHVPTTPDPDAKNTARAIALDVETTGFDFQREKIIELGIVPFTYDRNTGAILEIGERVSSFEDPGEPLSEEIKQLTGLTDDDLRGQSIDDASVERVFEEADLVIAHNARFDRPFIDRRFAFAHGTPWACSFAEIPWTAQGHECRKLGCLLKNHAHQFFTGHRATTDAEAVLSLLATPFEDGTSPMMALLASARAPSVRISAFGSPFETKDALKARGYRWDGDQKVWWIEMPMSTKDDELDWLKDEVYGGQSNRAHVHTFNATTRYAEIV